MVTLILFILILSLLIFVHEFGHFIVAKKSGIKVEEFGFGLPPRIVGKKVGETIYSLNWLPIGGFVRLFGEDGNQKINVEASANKRAFYQKSIAVRFSVLIAGVTMNLFLGILAFAVLYGKYGIPTKSGRVTVLETSAGSPAEAAGIKNNEVIYQINETAITSSKQFIGVTKSLAGKEVALLVGDDRTTRTVFVVPRVSPPSGEGPLGVIISDTVMKHYSWYQMPYLVLKEGFKEAFNWSGNVLLSLKTMAIGLVMRGEMPKDIAGPIGIYKITGQAVSAGWPAVVQFVGILSVNLAIINILPVPAMDGGRLLFLAYELVARRRVSPRIELAINNIGMATLLLLLVLITISDIIRLT